MSSLQNLVIELTRQILLDLDNPNELFHVALTCRFSHELIISTHHVHLHLTSVSCDSETSLKFWQKICVAPYYASMIRQLELCDQPIYKIFSFWRSESYITWDVVSFFVSFEVTEITTLT